MDCKFQRKKNSKSFFLLQYAAHQNQPTYFPIPTNLGTAPTDHNHHQTISKTFRKSVPIVKPFIFDGEPEQWLDWIGLFNATINSTDMTNSEKMTHLQKLVSGDAKSLIRGYGCNGAMYDAALQRLENDFGNPTKIVTSFLRRLDAISGPNLRHTRSYKDLANFLQTMVDTFTTLGFQHDLHSTTNVQTVLSKLPTPCRLEWNRYNLQCNIRQPSLIDLNNWFNKYAEACSDLPSNNNNNNTRNIISSNSYNSSNTQGSSSNGHTHQHGPSDHRANQNHRNQQRSQQQHKSGQKDQRRDFCPEKRNCQYLGKCHHFIAMNPKDRLQHARDLQLCFNCLSPHKFADCQSTQTCRTDGCSKKHHTLLHNSSTYNSTTQRETANRNSRQHEDTTNCSTSISRRKSTRHIPTLPITISHGKHRVHAYAMLDCGSKLTLLKSSIALQLKPDLQLDDTIQLNQALTSSDTASTKMTIAIGPYNQQKQPFQLNDIDVIMDWNLSQFNPELVNSICQRNEPLQHIRIATLPSKEIGIIIGCDFAELVTPSEVIHSKQNVPIGWKTPLGWSLCGRDNAATPNDVNTINFTTDDTLFRHVAEWIKLDAEGISTDQRSLSTDKEALRILESSTTRLPNGHYEVGMLWKSGQQLPNNRWLAKKQLDSLLQRLKRNTEMAQKYQETIDTDLQKGFIVKVDDSHEDSTGKWYLPHHPVTNINKPGKVRRVLNASSICKGVSLNSNLLTGPDLLTNLTGIVMRFREDQIAISADIEAMFMQVFVSPEDQPYLRFLWKDNTGQPATFQYTRHIFGATDSPCVACYATRQCAKDNADKYPALEQITKRNIYMDDLYKAVSTPTEVTQLMNDLQKMFSLGGFNLTKWTSNSQQFLTTVNENHLENNDSLTKKERPLERVLGVKWKPDTDVFLVEAKKFHAIDKKDLTQRKLLKFASSIFDPLGITMPLTIRLRQSLQLAWSNGPQWDKPLNMEHLTDLNDWIDKRSPFNDICLPRTYFKPETKILETQLHVFSDASELALASVAYLRIRYDDDTTELKFVIGKARVAPISRMTIPNLELQAATNGAKLSRFIKEQHDIRIDSTTLWTDSTTVLHWINSPNQRHRIFIANRLNFIMDSTSPLDWRYVPSKDNPADDGTRGYKACDMTTDSRWIKGPDFLLRPSSDWPNHPPAQPTADIHLTDNDPHPPTSVIDFNRFSTWTRALRVTSYVLLFAENIKRKTRQSLSLQHLTLGFAWIIKHSQNHSPRK